MGRAQGRKMPREIRPGTPEGDYIGLSDRQTPGPEKAQDSPIPGGRHHISNAQSVRQQVPVPEPRPEYRGFMEHGVPGESITTRERADRERGPNDAHPLKVKYAHIKEQPPAVPVYVVPNQGGDNPLRTAVPRHIIVPSMNGADPVLICGVDPRRTKIRLMNNDASTNMRIANDPTALVPDPGSGAPPSRTIGGALLVKGMTSYQDFETQDELWAVNIGSSGTTAELQIVMETSILGAG